MYSADKGLGPGDGRGTAPGGGDRRTRRRRGDHDPVPSSCAPSTCAPGRRHLPGHRPPSAAPPAPARGSPTPADRRPCQSQPHGHPSHLVVRGPRPWPARGPFGFSRKLLEHGIDARPARNAALVALAEDIPAPVLADVLGRTSTPPSDGLRSPNGTGAPTSPPAMLWSGHDSTAINGTGRLQVVRQEIPGGSGSLMSHTAHHIDRPILDGSGLRGTPWRSVRIVDLRYSAACLRQARRAGHRPRPMSLRHKVDVYSWARADLRDRSVAHWARTEERQARQRLPTP